jgi:hypothetical protein
MEVCPSELAELIEVTPEISDNCRSSGAATDVAIVSAFAPGNWADIWTVGMSTCGSGDRQEEVGDQAKQGQADDQ